MGSVAMSEVDYADIQGLVRFGYGQMSRAKYLLVRIKQVDAAKSWLRSASFTSAVAAKPVPNTALNLAFTAAGLTALGVNDSVMAQFSHEFRGGMAEESRARQLGDIGTNAPANWRWGRHGEEPHAVVMFFAKSGGLQAFVESAKGDSWAKAFEEVTSLDTSDLDEKEPFGFADGISQPQIDWELKRATPCTQWEYTNVCALGEFLLGYRNEYGKFTERPLLDAAESNADLLDAIDAPQKKDLGRNGTYLVMRQLEQDVRGFWRFLHEQAGGDPAEASSLGARMVGRTEAGNPLVPVQTKPIAGMDPARLQQNQFTYESDPAGERCPFGAHVRRANPRTTDFPERSVGLLKKLLIVLGFGSNEFRSDLISSVRFHRVLRRGREYGRGLSPSDAINRSTSDEEERGLHFICLNANICRQFEFLQNAWIANTKFAGMTGESDPLLGNREPIEGCPATSDFNLPEDGKLRRRISGLPQFVTVRGGGYFFLPSLRALRYLARA